MLSSEKGYWLVDAKELIGNGYEFLRKRKKAQKARFLDWSQDERYLDLPIQAKRNGARLHKI